MLGESARVRLLALIAEEELSIGELAELLADSQSNTSRHVAQLKRAGLADVEKHGTRVHVKLDPHAKGDPVVQDAIHSGLANLELALGVSQNEIREKISALLELRTAPTRAYFSTLTRKPDELGLELPAYLWAIGELCRRALLPARLAMDVGTGSGVLVDAIAPFVEQLIAVDREPTQLAQARSRVDARGYTHVDLVESDAFDTDLRRHVLREGGAQLVTASRVLHHASRPARALTALASLLAPGGTLMIIDYARHEDPRMQAQLADLWTGFEAEELRRFSLEAGLLQAEVLRIPQGLVSTDLVDGHLTWQVMFARKPGAAKPTKT